MFICLNFWSTKILKIFWNTCDSETFYRFKHLLITTTTKASFINKIVQDNSSQPSVISCLPGNKSNSVCGEGMNRVGEK